MTCRKVEIIITQGHNYHESVKGGAAYTRVRYSGHTYGCGSPCDTEEDIQQAIRHAKEVIKNHGDMPVLADKRKKAQLTNWF